jgi:drug/metabolite transporter (DMT)-like permease
VNALLLTTIAMLAFAANSLLCRLALGAGLIDAASFTAVRVLSGAAMLGLIILPQYRLQGRPKPNWRAVAMLFAYMIFFSIAYLSLGAGTGALILFGAVQLTMFAFALRGGERLPARGWIGFSSAAFGLLYLVSPGATAPDPAGAVMMTVAGIAWGVYSLYGRGIADPLATTAGNFLYCVPAVIVISLAFLGGSHSSAAGLLLAAASGAVASGLGYAIWYSALGGLTASRAATVQLSVPIIAAFGGTFLLAEPVSARLILASLATLGGIGLVLLPRQRLPNATDLGQHSHASSGYEDRQ